MLFWNGIYRLWFVSATAHTIKGLSNSESTVGAQKQVSSAESWSYAEWDCQGATR